MIRNSLPAVLQQVLEYHVNESPLTHDGELQGLYDRMLNLNVKIKYLKNKIKNNRGKASCDLFRIFHFIATVELRYYPHSFHHIVFHF